MVKVHIKIENELLLSKKGERFKTEFLNQLASDGQLIMESVTPRRTSRGANSYRVINKGGNSREIRNDTFYLPWVNDGTGIYGSGSRITPKTAKVLHFHWKGREWFVKSVKGQKPKHFVERGTNDIVKSIEKAVIIARNKTF